MPIPISKVLDDARALLSQHAELGRTTTIARAELAEHVHAEVRVGRHVFQTDEPEVAGGSGSAPSPVQYALGALAACEAVTYRYWSTLLDVPIDAVAVEARAEGDISGFLGFDPSVPAGIRNISLATRVRGPESRARYQDLHEAVLAHCPVLLALSSGVAIQSELRVGDDRL